MNRELAKQYRKRFKAVSKIETDEAKKLSVKQKFKQLCSLFSFAKKIGVDLSKKRKELYLNSNWATLKA